MQADVDESGTQYNRHACEKLFKFSLMDSDAFVPARYRASHQSSDAIRQLMVSCSYRGALLIWFMGMALAMTNFFLERLSGIRVISFHWSSDHRSEDEELLQASIGAVPPRHLPERLPPAHNLPMVPWYSIFLFDTVVQLLISFKVFLGRFDQRNMQRALVPDDDEYIFSHLKSKNHVWLDFMADTGDGFNSTYQIARLLAQPELKVDAEDGTKDSKSSTMTFPRGETLVIGGDLAYPFPDAETYETRLFRPFEYAMKPPPSYSPAALATVKPKPKASEYEMPARPAPTAFAIPGNHDWFDGLNTFTRLICQREWLGGWRLPQRTSHFALELPQGWWLFGVDVALEDDINSEQLAFFERVARTRMRPDDAVILLTHTPRWVLDVYESRTRSEEKLQLLMNTALRGRVALRLAGDVHNYMRHSLLSDEISGEPNVVEEGRLKRSNSSASSHSTSPRLAALSPTSKHFPHMFDDAGGVLAAAAAALTPTTQENAPVEDENADYPPQHLIISGGGGAFLHPTHAPNVDRIASNGATYERKQCYPPAHVSKYAPLLKLLISYLLTDSCFP